MDKNIVSVDSNVMVADAVTAMLQMKVWSLVVEKKGTPGGVITERDVIRRCLGKGLDPSKTTAGSIASTPILTIGPDATLREAMDEMAAKDIRRLFVVENGKIVGRVTQTELFQSTLSLMEMLSGLSGNL